MSSCYRDLDQRGLVHQVSDPSLPARLDSEHLSAYAGFDATADSLHLGSLIGILALRRLQEAGHRPIALAGGATALIGDPGGKRAERPLLDPHTVEANVAAIRKQLDGLLDFAPGRSQALLRDNSEWLGGLGLLDFLRDVGKHATVNHMMAKESVRSRVRSADESISFAEFSYMLLQAYDFMHLHDAEGCRLQLGGSDQWGNITMGIDLIRRVGRAEAWGLTWPLLLRPDGTKYGKTESETVWLDPARTSPYRLFQYLLRVDDDMVGAYLRYYTWLEVGRIGELESATASRPEARAAQRELARCVTALVHGQAEAAAAERAADVLFAEAVAELDERDLLEAFSDAPSSSRARSELEAGGLALVDLLVETGMAASRSAARRTVEQGGAYVNNRRRRDPDARLTAGDLLCDRYALVRKGRRDHHLVRFE